MTAPSGSQVNQFARFWGQSWSAPQPTEPQQRVPADRGPERIGHLGLQEQLGVRAQVGRLAQVAAVQVLGDGVDLGVVGQ